MATQQKSTLIQSVRDTFLTLDNARNAVFWWVVWSYATKLLRHFRARGVSTTIYELYATLAQLAFKTMLRVPSINRKVSRQLDAATRDMEAQIAPKHPGVTRWLALPETGKSADWVLDEMDVLKSMPASEWKKGRVSGAVYHGGEEVEDLIAQAFSKFVISNPLHPDVFPGVRKMEAEVIQMVLTMYNAPATGAGAMTSGGTESIVMACKAYRDWARAVKGITEPEMVIPVSAHAAFDKGGEYLGIKVHHIPVHPDSRKVNTRMVARAINGNTIFIVGSAPNFPDGAVDDISALSALAKRHKVGLHVDCCLGSFLVPFLERAGFPMDPFDFRLPGVTSISCDTHKYGFAPKGSSVIMYRNPEFRHYQYSAFTKWPGGVYASPSMAGSRPGALIAGAWATLMHMGASGYEASCREIMGAAKRLERLIRSDVPELRILGKPLVSVVAFTTTEASGIPVYAVGDVMSKKGWHLNALQNPPALHIACTRPTAQPGVVEQLVQDLKEAIAEAKKGSAGKDGTMVMLYGLGTASAIGPGLVEELTKRYLDVVLSA